MAFMLRDSEFGNLVRFLSRNRFFQYPDEIEPSLWRKSLRDKEKGGSSDPDEQGLDQAAISNASHDSARQAKPDLNGALEEGNDVFLVDWYGPDDPENPQNWSSTWKLLITAQICLFNFGVYMASSIYTAGEASIMEEFGVSETVATLGLSLYTVGYGLGPMLWSPMSEMPKLGRRSIYFWTLLAFVLLQLPTGYAVNMPMFLVFRVLTGFFGSPSLATGGATLSDIYDPARVSYAICIWGAFGILGPVFGPILGGFVAPAKGWRWTIWIITWLCSAVLVFMFFFMPETSAANILYKRARRLRKNTGQDQLRSQSEIDQAHHTTRDDLIGLGRAFTLTFTEPVVFFADLYTALLYGVLFIWFESFPLVFGGIYHFSPQDQGLVFLGIFIGGIITLPFFLYWIKYGIVARFAKPNFKPEMVLPPTFFGAISLPLCLFWYGWSARSSVHWIVPIIGSSFFTVAIITLFNPVLSYLGMSYPAYGASIFAGNALFRASFGAGFPLFSRQLFRKLGIGPGNSLLGAIAICFLPFPYIMYKYGDKIRHMSKNARHDI